MRHNGKFILVLLISTIISSSLSIGSETQDAIPDMVNNLDKALTAMTNSDIKSSQQLISLSDTVFDKTSLSSTQNSTLHFAGSKDLTNDEIRDYIIIVEHLNNPTHSGFSLLLLNGEDLTVILEKTEILPPEWVFQYKTSYKKFTNGDHHDFAFLFKRSSNLELCELILFSLLEPDLHTLQTSCETDQYFVDINSDNYTDFLPIDERGNVIYYDLHEIYSGVNPDQAKFPISIKPNTIEGEIENLLFSNFDHDQVTDYSFTQFSSISNETTVYTATYNVTAEDPGDLSYVKNEFTIPGKITNSVNIDIDFDNIDELLFRIEENATLAMYAVNGTKLQYSNIDTGFSEIEIAKIGDFNFDGIDDLILTNQIAGIRIIDGKDGSLIRSGLVSISQIVRNPSKYPKVTSAVISEDVHLVTFQEINNFYLFTIQNDGIHNIFTKPWNIEPNGIDEISKLSQFEFEQIVGITDDKDKDNDKINNMNEFLLGSSDLSVDTDLDNIEDLDELENNINLLNEDTDYDGMPDDYELSIDGLNPIIHDAYDDLDGDTIENVDEYNSCLEPDLRDTDDDGMDDGWELKYDLPRCAGNYNGYRNADYDSDNDTIDDIEEYYLGTWPNNTDTDGDGMIDGWEAKYYNATNPASTNPLIPDANLDYDNDQLSNFEEFLAGTSPISKDTDGDGLPDEWEVRYGLKPTINDAHENPDNDLFDNALEYRLGLNPTGRYDAALTIVILIALFGSTIFIGVQVTRVNREAKSEGFNNYFHKRLIRRLGFLTLDDYKEAASQGFRTAEAQNLILSYKASNFSILTKIWDNELLEVRRRFEDLNIKIKIEGVSKATSPESLSILEKSYETIFKQMDLDVNRIKSYDFEVQSIIEVYQRSKIDPIVGVDQSYLGVYKTRFVDLVSTIEEHVTKLDAAFNEMKSYFEPWASLLSLIQITGDGFPVSIKEISEIIHTTPNHATQLISLLLKENPFIGNFDEENNVYTKGTGVDVSNYLEDALSKLKEYDD